MRGNETIQEGEGIGTARTPLGSNKTGVDEGRSPSREIEVEVFFAQREGGDRNIDPIISLRYGPSRKAKRGQLMERTQEKETRKTTS